MKRKVLCCSPYMPGATNVTGGIAIWTSCIYQHYLNVSSNVNVEIFPLTRQTFIEDTSSLLKRIPSGIKEYSLIIKKLKKRIAKGDVEVLHLCTSASISLIKDLIIVRAARKMGIKTVVHFHFGRIPELYKANNWEWKLLKHLIKKTDVALTMSLESYNTLYESGFKNVEYLPNPLSDAALHAINIASNSHAKVKNSLLFVGHGYVTKGVYELVEGCARVKDAKLRVIGKFSPELKSDLLNIAKSRDNGTWIEFIGEIPHDSVLQEMAKADIFVFPSYTEGFPYVILEAMASKCAIISTGVGAIPEMLTGDNSNCGLLIPVKDSNAVSEAVMQMVSSEDMKKTISANAYERVNKLYTINAVWQKMCAVWENL